MCESSVLFGIAVNQNHLVNLHRQDITLVLRMRSFPPAAKEAGTHTAQVKAAAPLRPLENHSKGSRRIYSFYWVYPISSFSVREHAK